jgi:hypothetical protein
MVAECDLHRFHDQEDIIVIGSRRLDWVSEGRRGGAQTHGSVLVTPIVAKTRRQDSRARVIREFPLRLK